MKKQTQKSGVKAAFGKDITEYLRFYKMGLILISGLGIYLGLLGLYLIIVDNNYIPGIALFIAALLISPPPIGISNMIIRHFNIELSMGLKLGIATLLLFIAWWQLGF